GRTCTKPPPDRRHLYGGRGRGRTRARVSGRMRALRYRGPREPLVVEEVPVPAPGPGEDEGSGDAMSHSIRLRIASRLGAHHVPGPALGVPAAAVHEDERVAFAPSMTRVLYSRPLTSFVSLPSRSTYVLRMAPPETPRAAARLVDPLLPPLPLALAQHELLHLARRRLRERTQLDRLGALEVGERPPAVGDDVRLGERAPL